MHRARFAVCSLATCLLAYACSLTNRPADPDDPDEPSGVVSTGVGGNGQGGGSSAGATGGTGATSTSSNSTTGPSSGGAGGAGGAGGNTGTCGDGALSGSEACDDGNTMGGDGCNGTCAIEGTCQMPVPIPLMQQGNVQVGTVMAATGGMSQVSAATCAMSGMAGAGSDRIYQIQLTYLTRLTVTATGGFAKAVRLLGMPCAVSSQLPGACAAGAASASFELPAIAAGTYYVVVDSENTNTNAFTLTVQAARPQSCAPIFAANFPDGVYTIENNGIKDVYCVAGVTYEAFGFGQYNVTYPSFQLLGIADWQSIGVQNAFIWSYNTAGGMQNLQPGFNSGNCCFGLAGTIDWLNFGPPIEMYRVYPSNQNCAANCSGGYSDSVMRFHLSGFACNTMLASNYFQMNPPQLATGCGANNNPAIFVRRY